MALKPGLYPAPKVEPPVYVSPEAKAVVEKSNAEWDAKRKAAPPTTKKVALL